MRLNRKQIVAIAVGGSIVAAISTFYVIKTRTSLFVGKPLYCQEFPTKSPLFPKTLEVCILSIPVPFAPDNGDTELEITFKPSTNERMIVDAIVWSSGHIADREVDYTGEINYSNQRVFENNILAYEKPDKMSAWLDPLVPEDVHIPMWKWLTNLTPAFHRPKLSFEDKFRNWVDKFIELGAMGTTTVLTAWKVFRSVELE